MLVVRHKVTQSYSAPMAHIWQSDGGTSIAKNATTNKFKVTTIRRQIP
jgi:hypothetical protein